MTGPQNIYGAFHAPWRMQGDVERKDVFKSILEIVFFWPQSDLGFSNICNAVFLPCGRQRIHLALYSGMVNHRAVMET